MIKRFEQKDAEDLITLWQTCFGDGREYIESFFDAFQDEMTVSVHYENNVIVSALYSLSAKLVDGRESTDARYVYAVGTLPQ